ncbi:hypothetical protein [Streptomyces halstedii]|uniref:hypothetical protein n=1 Tax=Streptomyces halstedii TaxID=1944 RepID=UPI0036AA561E
MGAAMWSFTLDEDDLVIPEGPVGTEENLRIALETLIIPFGTQAESVEIYLREWRKMWQQFGPDYILGTSSAAARRVGPGVVEIEDLYGQFETCKMSVREFESALESMIAFLEEC